MEHLDARTDVAALGDLVAVWAHPDDESYLAAGLMALAVEQGAHVTCVTATAGERGGPVDQQAELAWRRPEELQVALAALGVHDLVLLGHPDGGCAAVDPHAAAAELAAVLEDRRPSTVVTFGPDGVTGHPDHVAVSGWVDLAIGRLADRTPVVLHANETVEQLAILEAAGHPELAEETGGAARPCAEVDLHLVLDEPSVDRKLRALRAHRTQTASLERLLGAATYRAWVRTESFVRAPVPALAVAAS